MSSFGLEQKKMRLKFVVLLSSLAFSAICLTGAADKSNTLMSYRGPQTIVEAKCDINSGFRTQTIGGWGSVPRGDNPAQFLKLFFTEAFPSGLSVGKGTLFIKFTSAQAVASFLPSTGPSKAITKSFTNPVKSDLPNTFASQLIGATLNVTFDGFDNAFSISPFPLSGLLLTQGPLAGKSVSEVVMLSNAALVGENVGFSLTDLNSALSLINESFVDGKRSNTAVKCP